MVERHIIMPSAGRMRPKTSESGIFSTKRRSPVSTSMLTRMLVPKPKKAFQSPGVHNGGCLAADDVIARSCPWPPLILGFRSGLRGKGARSDCWLTQAPCQTAGETSAATDVGGARIPLAHGGNLESRGTAFAPAK